MSRAWLLPVLMLICGSLSRAGCAQQAAGPAEVGDSGAGAASPAVPTADHTEARRLYPQLETTTWYSVEAAGARTGYASIEANALDLESAPRLRVVARTMMRIALLGQSHTVRSEHVTVFGPDLRPASYVAMQDQFGREEVRRATVVGNELTVYSLAGGESRWETLALGPHFGSDMQLNAAAVDGKLAVGQVYELEQFLPELGVLDQQRITVEAREPVPGQPEAMAFKLRAHSQRLNADILTWIDDRGEMARQEVPSVLSLVLARVPAAQALEEFSPLVLSPSIPTDRSISNPRGLSRVRLRARGLAVPASDLIPQSPRQTVTTSGDETTVELRAQQPPLQSARLPVQGDGLEAELRATELVQSDSERIQALARKIIGEQSDAWKAAGLLADWVFGNLRKVDSDPRPVSALEILKQGAGDCTEHSTLMVALARAVGLPARMVVGAAWTRDAFYYHAWVEVYVGEWVEMDPTWGEHMCGAGHLRLGRSALDKGSFIQMALAAGRTMGALELDVLGTEER